MDSPQGSRPRTPSRAVLDRRWKTLFVYTIALPPPPQSGDNFKTSVSLRVMPVRNKRTY